MSLVVELVRVGKPRAGETRASRDLCRAGHPLTGSNRIVQCRLCHNVRAAEITRRSKARRAGTPIMEPMPAVVPCSHDLSKQDPPLVRCRQCKRTTRTAHARKSAAQSKQQSAK